ncbi:MAG: hypothetical protein R2795_10655 [Saprospiraceae bacterium]
MIDKLLKSVQDASEAIREQAGNIGAGAKEKTYEFIEDWLQIVPTLEAYGLEVHSFALGVALSPSLEIDFKGTHADFTPEKLDAMLAQRGIHAGVKTVVSTIKTTYGLHRKIKAPLREPLLVKVRIKLSPEVKVFIGEPIIQ